MDDQAGWRANARDGLRPRLRVAAFDVAATWNAPRSFHGAAEATCFNFFSHFLLIVTQTGERGVSRSIRTAQILRREKNQSLCKKQGGVPDVLFRALIFTWFSGGKLSQTLCRCPVAHTVNQPQPTP